MESAVKLCLIICAIAILITIVGFCTGCKTCESVPVIIRPLPTADLSDDMTLEQYLAEQYKYSVDQKAYILDLINQILHGHRYIDLR